MNKNVLLWFGIGMLLITSSCFPNKDGKLYPIPPANPFFISSDEQTLDIKVKNLADIEPYKSHWDDEISYNTGGYFYSILIENEWITIYYERSDEKRSLINVSVKENNSDMHRSYNLQLKYKPQTTFFTITQKPKY